MPSSNPASPPRLLTAVTNAELLRVAAQSIQALGNRRVWVAAPQRQSANQLLHFVLSATSQSGETNLLDGTERGSLWQLAVRLATPSLSAQGLVPATKLGLEAAIFRALRSLARPLTALQEVADSPGLPGRLSATIRELREAGVDPDLLQTPPRIGKDLNQIIVCYREALDQAKIADTASVYQHAIKALKEAQNPPLDGLLALDHPLRSRAEVEFACALAAAGIICVAAIQARDQKSINRYLQAWPDCQGVEPISHNDPSTGLGRLRQRLFSLKPNGEPQANDQTVQIVAAAGEEREALEMARAIQARAKQGVPYDRIGIMLRSPEGYQPVLEEAFVRAEIPAYFSRGVLRPDPSGRAFLALLSCKAEGLSANRFAEYLSLGQVPALVPQAPSQKPDSEASPPTALPWVASQDDAARAIANDEQEMQLSLFSLEDATTSIQESANNGSPRSARFPRRWEDLLVEASVIGGSDRWQRRLEGLEHELGYRLQRLAFDQEAQHRAIRAALDQVENLKAFALPLIKKLDDLPQEADVGDWVPDLEQLARASLRQPRRVLTLLADLRPMAGVGAIRFSELRHLLEERLGLLRVEPDGTSFGKVYLGTAEDFRGLTFDTVLVPGMAEGIFPSKVREDPLLLDTTRHDLDSYLVTNEDRISEERLRLQVSAASAEAKLIISYPSWDGLTGRARVPSFYAFDAVAAAYGDISVLTGISSTSPLQENPNLALDDAEYDIVRLLPLLRSRANRSPGQANYLLRTNPHLARSLRVRGRRWLNFLSAVDGLVTLDSETSESEQVLEKLASYSLRERAYSPTALQHFAACPYRFYLQGILRLRPRDDAHALEQIDPLTRGSLYHAIQFRFLHQLQEQGSLELGERDEDNLLTQLDQVIEEVAAEYADRLRPALPVVFQGEVESIRTDLRGWLRQLLAHPEFAPAYFELSFGLPRDLEHDPASSKDPAEILDGFQVKGSIDMVEKAVDGVYRVTDHKTGKPRDTRSLVVGGGEALQPLIYAYAAEQLLDAEVGEGRLWYATRKGRFQSLTVATGQYQQQSLTTVFQTIDQSMATGFFPAAPRERACQYCDYRSVCGPHEELRIAIKMRTKATREQLSDLTHVRKME